MAKGKKIFVISLIVVAVLVAIFFYIKFYFVFTEGVKTGHLNYIIKKGYIFKTYEGKMIQSGFKTVQSGYIQSNEFEFSIQNQRLADSLMRMDENKEIILYYKEYLGAIPWRGYSKYIVDSIVSVRDIIPQGRQEIIPPVPPFE